MTLLEKQKQRLLEAQSGIDTLLASVETAGRSDLTAEEDAQFSELRAERDAASKRVADLEAEEEAREAYRAAHRETGPVATIGAEPMTYDRHSGNSYFLDLAREKTGRGTGASDRLIRHAQELEVELPKREAQRTRNSEAELHRSLGRESSFERHTNPNRTDGQGGYFVPPLWLIDEFIELARNGRPFANAVRQIPLPSGTDSINLPKISTGTTTAAQQDGGSVSSTDLTDDTVSAPVRTIAGQQDVALQLLDQSPIAFDEVVFADLIADYNYQLDLQCVAGAGTSGTLTGIDAVSSINTVTYTDASPTVPELFPSFGKALSLIATNRKRMDGLIWVMHPRRWFWLASQLDGSNRPFIVPSDQGPQNTMAVFDGSVAAEGPVGRILSVPVLADLSVPVLKTAGAGSSGTEDAIYAVRASDIFLFEGALRSRALVEVLSGTLQVRLQVYNYAAFLASRLPKAISTISGTGLAAPSGY